MSTVQEFYEKEWWVTFGSIQAIAGKTPNEAILKAALEAVKDKENA